MKRLSHSNQVVVALVPVLVGAVPAVAQSSKAQPNAYDFYMRAGKALDYKDQGPDFPFFNDAKLNAPFASPWARREAVLRRNARALSLMRQGFAFSYSPPPVTSYWNVVRYPLFPQTRQMARLLGMEAEVYAHRGEYAKSVNSGIDAIRLSKDISRGMVGDLLVGNAIAGIGQSQIKKATIEKLSAAEAAAAAQRLEKLEARDVSYANALREEKRFGNLMLREMFKEEQAQWRKEYPTTKTPRQLTVDYNRLMDEAIINATLPFALRKATLSRANDELNKTMTDLYTNGMATTGQFQARYNTSSQLLKTMLALRAYKVEHGNYPATLSELAPKYLRRVPMDPFANNKPLRYKTTGIEYSLYSIGYDGVDDGGRALPKRARPDAKGDIVAGINTR